MPYLHEGVCTDDITDYIIILRTSTYGRMNCLTWANMWYWVWDYGILSMGLWDTEYGNIARYNWVLWSCTHTNHNRGYGLYHDRNISFGKTEFNSESSHNCLALSIGYCWTMTLLPSYNTGWWYAIVTVTSSKQLIHCTVNVPVLTARYLCTLPITLPTVHTQWTHTNTTGTDSNTINTTEYQWRPVEGRVTITISHWNNSLVPHFMYISSDWLCTVCSSLPMGGGEDNVMKWIN